MRPKNRPTDLIALAKPRITSLVLVSAAGGFMLGAGGSPDVLELLSALVGIGLVAGGTNALNQLVERDVDALMVRTRGRPLPAGKVTPVAAATFSLTVAIGGVAYLAAFTNLLTAALALATLLSYVFVYTPLKRLSSLSTLAGAIPGALPIAGGWTAATGDFGPAALALFGILFFWQLPHFLALAWLHREDYRRAGLRMLGVDDPRGLHTRQQSVLYAMALLPTSLLPVLLGLSGLGYALAALTLSVGYLGSAVRFALRADSPAARGLFKASLLYLPLLLAALTLDPSPRLGSGGGTGEPPPIVAHGSRPQPLP